MHSEPEDRLSHKERTRVPTLHIGLAVVALIVIGAAIYAPTRLGDPPAVADPTPLVTGAVPPVPAPAMPPAPDIPDHEPAPTPQLEQPPVEVEVSLATSDQELREIFAPADASSFLAQVLDEDDLVLRSAGLIDGLSQGGVPRKVLPLAPPKDKFSTINVAGQTLMDPASYMRYDNYARAIAAVNVDLLVATFHRYRALIEQAYAEFGYSAEDLDNALIRSLDYVLATPEPPANIVLKRKEAVFQYADPDLERLTPLQKQLLRMGPENSALIKRQAESLRKGLLGTSPGA